MYLYIYIHIIHVFVYQCLCASLWDKCVNAAIDWPCCPVSSSWVSIRLAMALWQLARFFAVLEASHWFRRMWIWCKMVWPEHAQAEIAPKRWFSVQYWIYLSGWWFGTFFIFPYIGNNHPNWLIFFRGFQTTNQLFFGIIVVLVLNLNRGNGLLVVTGGFQAEETPEANT